MSYYILHNVRPPDSFSCVAKRCQLSGNNEMVAFRSDNDYYPRRMKIGNPDEILGVVHDIPNSLLTPIQVFSFKCKHPFATARHRTAFLGYDTDMSNCKQVWLSLFSPQSVDKPRRLTIRPLASQHILGRKLALSACGTRAAEVQTHAIEIYDIIDINHCVASCSHVFKSASIRAAAFLPDKDRLALLVVANSIWYLQLYELTQRRISCAIKLPSYPSAYSCLYVHDSAKTYMIMCDDTSVWSGNLHPVSFTLQREYAIFASVSRGFHQLALALVAAVGVMAITPETYCNTMYALEMLAAAFFVNSVIR